MSVILNVALLLRSILLAGRPAPVDEPVLASLLCIESLADTMAPSRKAFFYEVLFPNRTVRTDRFDSYSAGSYHLDRQDLIENLPATARGCDLELRAVIIFGPSLPLRTYRVFAAVASRDSLHLNALIMPH